MSSERFCFNIGYSQAGVYEIAWHLRGGPMTGPVWSDALIDNCSNVYQPRLIAFYLPQFHPIPENDLWWGKGFTEWTNVTKAKPLFEGHYQPHLPSELGFYDLRLREVRHEQIALAKQYGIDGFCYHYYWFSGKRLLHRPIDDMLKDPASDMPFCISWANENWTRRWDGMENEALMVQGYRPEDHLKFIESLVPFFEDKRYIRLNGAPILLVYYPQHIPNPRRAAEIWREYCLKNGIGEIHLCAALTFGNTDYSQFDFDSGVEFPPHNLQGNIVNEKVSFYEDFHGRLYEYANLADSLLARRYENGNVFRTVFPSWDNTARRGSRSTVILNATPEKYEYWLSQAIRLTGEDFHKILVQDLRADGHSLAIQKSAEEFSGRGRFVFINAWNEWAEGCHLEPDRRYGRQFLEATLRAKAAASNGLHCELVTQPLERGKLSEKSPSPGCTYLKEGRRVGRGFGGWAEKLLSSLPLFANYKRKQNESQDEKHIRDCYLSLIENCLTGTIYEDPPMCGSQLGKFNLEMREAGLDWPVKAHTMAGVKRLANLRFLVEKLIEHRVPGDLMETGVWRGGACILMRAVLNAYRVTDRRVWVADSFQGVPPPDPEYPADENSVCHTYPEQASTLYEVMRNFAKYGLLDDQVVFLPGWFHETLPVAPVESLALLRLDGGTYKSTIVALNSLYDKLSVGGYIIVDDYHIAPQAKLAVDDFITARQISPEFKEVDGFGVYWLKE